MKMGEVVEDANSSTINIHTSSSSSSQQQHLQVASNVLVEDDEDEDDAENGRLARQYSESLRDLQLNFHDDNNDSSYAKSCEESDTRRRRLAVSPFTVLLPKQVEKRRRDLSRRYLQVLKRTRAKEPPRSTLKAKKIYELRFLEATYVRNVLYQSLPHCQLSASVPAATSLHSGNVSAGGSTPQGSQTVNNVSGGGSTSNSNNSRLSSSDKHAASSDGERTLFGVGGGLNDHSSSSTVVPICSVIPDYKPVSGVWYKCLKSKAMNARKPNHLIQATYEQFPPRGKNKQWLSSQPKKVRTSQRSVGGGEAAVVVSGEKSSTSSSSTSAALAAAPSVTPIVADKNKNSSVNDDSKKSSATTSNNASLLKLGISGDSRPASDTPLQVLSNKETNINANKANPPVTNPGRKISFKLEQMRPRSLDKEGHQQHEHRLQAVKLEQNHTPSSNATSSSSGNIFLNNINNQEIGNRSSLPTPLVAAGISKEELDKGRKTSSTSSTYLTIALNNNTRKGASGSDASKSAAATTSSSNSSELSLKSVISENTDSSSSSTTSGSTSSNSFSDSLSSSLRASNNGSTLSPNIASANNSTAGNSNNNTSSSGGNTRANNSNLNSSSTANELTNTSSSSPSSSSTSNHGGSGGGGSGGGNAKSNRRLGGGTPGGGSGGGGPKAPKKYSEKMKAEASVVQRISELQKEGMWWEKRLPKVYEPPRAKSHWDYLLEEMTWMSSDFMHERKWKRNAAKKCSRMIEKYFHDKALKRQKAEKEEEARKKRMAGGIAKLVRQFWANVQTVVEFKEQTMIESIKKKALDQKLSYLVNETEKYSEIVAQTFTAIAKKTGIDKMDSEGAGNDVEATKASSEAGSEPTPAHSIKEEVASPAPTVPMDDADTEFVPPSDSESDVDDTIAEEEAKERVEAPDHKNELDDLERENSMSYEELLAKYANYLEDPEAFKEPTDDAPEPEPPKPQETTSRRLTRGRVMSERQLRTTPGRRVAAVEPPPKIIESDVETDVDDDSGSSTEEESQDEEDENGGSDAEKTNEDLASLLKSISGDGSGDSKRNTEEETNKLADLAESFKPKGNTLSSTTVVTKVPHLLRHTLREYQHIGLDWLVAMYDKKLNGILADEMGLGKTIQTIALLAYLAVDRCNWGPHLIIVPTSVMLNWEMEFKKWCPGFKILTYYGSQKERKLKRSGWTKPNAFHVCITSYKLVIQDHQSFRRKRWKYLILDEAQNIKNFKSQRWQLLLNFHTQRRLLLTGTPLQNNLMELWSLLHFLMPNVFQSHMEFKDWFSNPMSGMVEGSQEYNEDIVRRLHKVLRPFILRRMKTEVEKQLPQKYEHVVMCSLSKRQRYLYEEFMARSKTKDTLNQGNLLSVINVLMQLRKVCNHPNLFEPRPIVSPFQTEGIDYRVPACVWDIIRELNEDSFRQYFPLFTVSNIKFSYSEDEAQRIGELTPLFAYNPDEDRRYVVMNYQQCGETKQPPAKRVKRIVNLVKNEPPPCPRLQRPLTFFMTNGPPDKVLQDKEFMDYLRNDARQKQKAYGVSPLPTYDEKDDKSLKAGSKVLADDNKKPITTDKPVVLDLSDSDNDDKSSSDSDFEVVVVKKRKIPVPSFNVMTRLQMMGATVPDFELDYIQERRLQDRKLVVNNLNKVNWARCRVQTCANSRLLESCQIVGALPPIRLTSRKTGFSKAASSAPSLLLPIRERPRDYISHGYFNLGFDDIMKIIRMRQENPNLFHHPLMMWQTTKHLEHLVTTPERRLKELMSLLTRYVMYIPAVRAPALESIVYRPASSTRYFSHLNQIDEYRKVFNKSTDIVHPIISRMHTHFPDPRLIQYDCGKLQTLDTLLRRLKTGNHRVLIFTQMAKVLDILEAFLNYHGHTYLRLDGATKIDQRQLLMERFNADKKIFCFILSTRSGGIGVNLTGADTVIFYDSDWNPTMDAQAQDRCHRIGQTRDVHIYRLVSEKTVEENILKKSNQKRLLGELAIEGGKFTTTYFKQHTIRELFAINEKDDVTKRLNAWNTDPSSSTAANKTSVEEEEDSSFDPTDIMRSPEKKHEMQMIECALAAAEDDTDVQAAQTVHAEAEAEMAEFDENVSLDALDDGKSGPNKFDLEFQQVYSQLTGVERYAIQLMESTIDDWSKETVAQAQKDLEEQKMAWELQQQQKYAQESPSKMDIDDDCPPEDILTYSRLDNLNQVWVAQFGTFEQEMLFPIYEPPTPPHDDMDVYFDTAHGYLYDYEIMNEDQLPPVYIPKHPKKPVTPVSTSPVSKPGGLSILEKTPEAQVIKDPSSSTNKDSPEMMDMGDSDASPQKKSPKVGRREDPIFAPKSLFDKPSPALAKIRRDLRMQRYSNRPASHSPKTSLGPGSITFPIVNPAAQKTPPPPAPVDSPSWLIAEDYSLLNTIKNVHELPTNLMLINTGQTPNWDYAHEAVNTAGLTHRTAKQCKWRYENVVAPREEGKIVFETPATTSSGPTSPSSGKKKKSSKAAASFIKINPPSPSKASRLMKVTQLLSQDNNAQYKDAFCEKFDTVKAIANKRAPTTKPASVSGTVKTSNKHSQVVTEMGINYDNPLPAVAIAQSRYDRIQMERKKLEMQRQQQVALQQATQAAASMVGNWAPSNVATSVTGQTLQQQQQQQQPQTLATAGVIDRAVATIMATSTISTNAANATPASAAVASKVRGQFTSVTIPGGITPLVLASSSPEVNIHRDVNIPNIIAQQRTVRQQQQQQELTAQQQQQLLIQQQKQAIIQHQQLTNLLSQQSQQQQQQQLVQTSVATSQQPTGIPTIQSQNPNVTVLTAGGTVVGSTSQTQQQGGIRASGAPPIQVQTQQQTQTVVLAPGLAQALAQASSVGSPISVSSSAGVNTSTPMTAAVSTTPTSLPGQVQRHLQQQQASIGSQPQLQRVPTITMQDLVSTAAAVSSAQRIQTGIISTSAPTVPVSAVSSQSQPTLVSLTPMIVSSAQQLATRLNAQGLLVQSSPTRAGASPTTLTAQQAGSKLGPLQLQQYLSRSGIMRPSSPTVVSSPLSQQQQVLKEQLMPSSPHQQINQIKRIQVVAASPPPTMVSGASSVGGQQQQVSLPSVSTITSGGTQYSTIPAVVQASSTPIVTISSTGTTSKVALAQPNVTMAAISSANVSPATASTVVQGQRQVQLVKQHTVGGKTVTRPVTDAEVAAFLKHHGIPAITNTVSGQSVLPGSPKNPTVATFQGSVPVQGASALLTVGLQNIMKVQQGTPGGSVATLVKSQAGQGGPTSAAGQTLAFPVHLSKINTAKGTSPGTPTSASPKQQQVQTLTGVQQLMIQRRQQQDQQQAQQQQVGSVQSQQQTTQTLTQGGTPVSVSQGGKIAHITTQVTPQGTIPTHVVVQKQLPNTIAVQQLQQVFKQVGATGQVITGQGGQMLQAQMIGKPIAVSGNPNTITVTTSGGVTSSQSALTIPPTSSVQSSAASLVHIPNLVQAASSSGPIHARIVPVSVNLGSQQPGSVKQTIQVVSGPPPPNATLIGTGPLTVRPPPPVSGSNVQTVNSIQIKLPTSSNMPSQNPEDKNN